MKLKFLRYFYVPFSFIYYLMTLLRNFLYDKRLFHIRKLPVKVISVGNITWGGTGKTPAVLSIAGVLGQKGINITVLTRGYGKDENKIIGQKFPIVTGKDRFKSGMEAVERYKSEAVILDDGFQHRRLYRDIDIVCIDGLRPFGNGFVIPTGCMREGLYALKRADIFLLTKIDLTEDSERIKRLKNLLEKINPRALIAESAHEPDFIHGLLDNRNIDTDSLRKNRIALVSAIGNPVSFERTVGRLGLGFKRHFIFGDHYRYREKDINHIEEYCSDNDIDYIITTEKDAVKLKNLSGINRVADKIHVLGIKLRITKNEQRFYNRLFGIFNC